MNNIIPKIAHVSWKYKNILKSQSPIILNGLNNLIHMNPDWNVILYDNDDVDKYLRNNLHQEYYELIQNTHIVEKSDVWRLLKIYNEGGLYIDIDRFYNVPLSQILTENIKCVLPMCLDYNFSQDIMLSAPGNPIYAVTLEMNLQRRKQGHTSTYFLGPQTYMHGITQCLFGEIIDENPGLEKINHIRNELSKIPFIKTYRENLPYDTIVYKHDDEKFNYGNSKEKTWEKMKREFYAQHNIKHWTGEW